MQTQNKVKPRRQHLVSKHMHQDPLILNTHTHSVTSLIKNILFNKIEVLLHFECECHFIRSLKKKLFPSLLIGGGRINGFKSNQRVLTNYRYVFFRSPFL